MSSETSEDARSTHCRRPHCVRAMPRRRRSGPSRLSRLRRFAKTGYRRLMEAHVAAGNRAEALRVYEQCRRLLAEELGTYPSPETESIYRGLLEEPPARSARDRPHSLLRRLTPMLPAARRLDVARGDSSWLSPARHVAAAGLAPPRCSFAEIPSGCRRSLGRLGRGLPDRERPTERADPRGTFAERARGRERLDLGRPRRHAQRFEGRSRQAGRDPEDPGRQRTGRSRLGGGFVWVANSLDGTVSRIDPRTRHSVAAGSRSGTARRGWLSIRRFVWVANSSDGTVTRIDRNTGKPLGADPVGPRARTVLRPAAARCG